MSTKIWAAALFTLTLAGNAALAEDTRASREEAEKMVHRGIEFLKKNGRDKTAAEITAPSRTFVDRDLYLVIYDLTGTVVAHGQNPKQVGKNLIELKDPDGKPFVQERVELAKSRGTFWQDYKFTDPLTKKVLPKQSYCAKEGDLVLCGGVYKPGT